MNKARAIPAAVRERLAKLVPRLATTFIGERVAVVSAIERTLSSAGLDWHDVSALFAHGDPAPSRDSERQEIPAATLIEVVEDIEAAVRIGGRTRDFLATMRRLARDYDPVRLSAKQAHWLAELHRRSGALR